MAVSKLSQIATGAAPALTDTVIGVSPGPIDRQYTIAQLQYALGLTFYVSTAGNDSNDGLTPATPWQTIAKVNASTFKEGSCILFKGGQTFTGAIVSPNGGTSENPIIFGSYGGGVATISSGTSNGFTSTNQPGLTVRDLNFTGTASSNRGIFFQNTTAGNVHYQGISVLNCNVSGYGLDGILLTASVTYGGYDDILIDGCQASNCCSIASAVAFPTAGIGVFSMAPTGQGLANGASFNNVTIRNCNSNNNIGAIATTASGYGFVIAETILGRIYGCVADANGASSNASNGTGPVGIIIFDSQFVIIDACTSKNTGTANNVDGEGFDLDFGCSKCTIRNSLSQDNAGPGFYIFAANVATSLISNSNSILNCISINDGAGASNGIRAGIAINAATGAGLTSIRIANNTVYESQTGTSGIYIPNSGNSAAITGLVNDNTLIISGAQNFVKSDANPAGLLFNGNRYNSAGACSIVWNGTTYTDLSAWQAATGQETDSVINATSATMSKIFLNNTVGGSKWEVGSNNTHSIYFFEYTNFRTPFAINATTDGVSFSGLSSFGWTATNFATDAVDTGLGRHAAGVVEINNGVLGTILDLIVRNEFFVDGLSNLTTISAGYDGVNTYIKLDPGGSATPCFIYSDGSFKSSYFGSTADVAAIGSIPGFLTGVKLANNAPVLWSSNATWFGTIDTGITRNAARVVEVNNGSAGSFGDILTRGLRSNATTFTNAIVGPAEGTIQAFTDSTTNVWGAVITGGGANHVLGYFNGTNWTVMAK